MLEDVIIFSKTILEYLYVWLIEKILLNFSFRSFCRTDKCQSLNNDRLGKLLSKETNNMLDSGVQSELK